MRSVWKVSPVESWITCRRTAAARFEVDLPRRAQFLALSLVRLVLTDNLLA
jgi:hypothetical protein